MESLGSVMLPNDLTSCNPKFSNTPITREIGIALSEYDFDSAGGTTKIIRNFITLMRNPWGKGDALATTAPGEGGHTAIATPATTDRLWQRIDHDFRVSLPLTSGHGRSTLPGPHPQGIRPRGTLSDSESECDVHWRCEGRYCRFCQDDAATSRRWTTDGLCPSCYNHECGGLHCTCKEVD